MDDLEEAQKQIGKEFKVNPYELDFFTDGKCTMTYEEKPGIKWFIDVALSENSMTMTILDIRKDCVLKVTEAYTKT